MIPAQTTWVFPVGHWREVEEERGRGGEGGGRDTDA